MNALVMRMSVQTTTMMVEPKTMKTTGLITILILVNGSASLMLGERGPKTKVVARPLEAVRDLVAVALLDQEQTKAAERPQPEELFPSAKSEPPLLPKNDRLPPEEEEVPLLLNNELLLPPRTQLLHHPKSELLHPPKNDLVHQSKIELLHPPKKELGHTAKAVARLLVHTNH